MKNTAVNFKGYVPVYYYSKNPADGKFYRVEKKRDIKKCQSFVVRNLNGTAKHTKNDKFVKFYEKYDDDYKQLKKVKTIYDNNSPDVYLLTGQDAQNADLSAKPIGKAKDKAKAKNGKTNSQEVKDICTKYYNDIKDYIKNSCKRLKNSKGQDLSLYLFYEPKYNRKNEIKSYRFLNAGLKIEA